jgi:hypothetical protein
MVWHKKHVFLAVTLAALAGFAAGAAAEDRQASGRAKAGPAQDITGVLASVDTEHGTITLRRVGADVDDVLLEKLKEAGKPKEAAGAADAKDPTDAKDSLVVAMASKAQIYIKFRTSPSVANNVTHPLADLREMIGYPVTIKGSRRGNGLVADEVIAWRGTPWKASK